jgi:ssDNA-binding Zn-finger/Zn-ribbon topoisomerase 1
MVSAQSGCVIMNVKGNNVLYYQKCNHCQFSESDKPLREVPYQKEGIGSYGEYTCPKCGGVSKVEMKYRT